MPRTARVKSRTGVYHVMLRGVNQQQIFFDEEDYLHFTDLLGRYKRTCGFRLYAYCLMGNHVHLLMKTGAEPLGDFFKRLICSYVFWYNSKYERVGHLFQNRFRSEPVDSKEYFLTVLRYILRNPVNAGLCRFPQEYIHSSAREYFDAVPGISDVTQVFRMANYKFLRNFILENNEDQCLELRRTSVKRITDKAAKELIYQEFGSYSPMTGKDYERQALDESIRKILKEGVSIRQLSRLTGISKKVIEGSLKKEKEKERETETD